MAVLTASDRASTLLIDGGELACGELLMLVARRVRLEPAGTLVGVTTTDPAAAIDIPAWCHLAGHRYRGPEHDDLRDLFLIELGSASVPVDPNRPWQRLTDSEVSG